MAKLDLLIKALDTSIWELGEGFKGLPDGDLWKRPHPKLLSIGEIAAHIAYWEAKSFFGEGFQSELTIHAARYYSSNIQEPFQLELGSEAVYDEVKRIHDACRSAFQSNPHDSEESNPNRVDWTWGFTLEYQVFHVAYHTGQVYSIRHLLGHETVDN